MMLDDLEGLMNDAEDLAHRQDVSAEDACAAIVASLARRGQCTPGVLLALAAGWEAMARLAREHADFMLTAAPAHDDLES